MRKFTRFLFTLLLCLAFFVLGAGLALMWMQRVPVQTPQIMDGEIILEEEETDETRYAAEEAEDAEETEEIFRIPTDQTADAQNESEEDNIGKIYISEARKKYNPMSMQLVIPKLKIHEQIHDGVTGPKLDAGDGLYPYAQMPSEENGNVSIAGHRNGTRNGRPVPSRPFYYLNTLTEGDYLYLVYDNVIYQYLWECTEVVEPDNWDPIRNRGYSCITLTTCTPIGVADHRLIVRGVLVDSFPAKTTVGLPESRELP